MIESDGMLYEISKIFLKIFVFIMLPISILSIIYLVLFNFFSFLIHLVIVSFIFLLLISIYKKSKTNYYKAKIDEDRIHLKRDGET